MSSTTPPPNSPAVSPTGARSGHFADQGRAGPGLPIKTPVTSILEASKPIAFNINFARITGDAKAALFLSQLVYWTRRGADVLDNDGWVFKTRENWEAELGLSKHEQATARSTLIELGLIEEARTGAPARNCYRVMPNVLGAHLAQLVRTEPVQWSLLDIRSDNQDIRSMLGRQFAFYRVLMQITTTCTSAIYLSKALAIQRRFADRPAQQTNNFADTAHLPWDAQWFRMAVDSTQAETGLSPAQQREAKHKLCQMGLMHEAMMTHPRKQVYLRIDMQMLNQLLLNAAQKTGGQNRTTEIAAAACQNRTTEDEPGSDQSKDCGISGKWLPGSHLPTLPQPAQSGSIGISAKWLPGSHLATLPKTLQAEHVPGPPGDPPDGLNAAACQNRPTRMTDSDKLDGRFSQGRWPDSARPVAGFSTFSRPVLAGLHAHASRVRQDYEEDYTQTTTTPLPDSNPAAEPSTVANSPPKGQMNEGRKAMETSGPLADPVVVVVDSKPPEGESVDQWIWPKEMSAADRQQGARLLGSLAKTGQLEDAQNILDELAGWVQSAIGVRSPLSYLRKLIHAHQSTPGGLVYEKADAVRRQRRSEQRNADARAQMQAQTSPAVVQQDGVTAGGSVVLSDTAKAGLAKAREMLATLKPKKGSS
jgi:hypothetical protein